MVQDRFVFSVKKTPNIFTPNYRNHKIMSKNIVQKDMNKFIGPEENAVVSKDDNIENFHYWYKIDSFLHKKIE